ncbi:hypothetical protein GCM10011583_36540 [Streptomyces camponoticapitis]|uniref:DUF5709 domain-containing protein n=1 Tax=Streptomyces camponoticapitis TaxID=1616125 RepID=A0ABQ2E9U6_9ACTN|nr:hypothetical protein [Streptomyces camponoticapitis]GGK01645.1 hypothetical protein GCM10011583_36540 [Streptomyces camponoticapitis]
MNDRHPGEYDSEDSGGGEAVPRDLPDQHARPGDDPLDVEVEGLGSSGDLDSDPDPDRDADADSEEEADTEEEAGTEEEPDPELPETDEAGAGRRGSPSTGGVHEQPVPDEPSG